ncbi:MAG TPA: D-alanine--D-alanine ligase [Candidatus Omnitrophota bacterium]|nr:D-alanine--D-alanine ligase [Candidatus Omnitrophota bacterium]
MKVGFTYDLKSDWVRTSGDPRDASAEYDTPQTIDAVAGALASEGHEVLRIGNLRQLLDGLDTLDVDLVFNICEGIRGRNRESQVPVLLEARDIPYVGSDGLTMALTLDKVMAKKCFLADGILTPRSWVAHQATDIPEACLSHFPLFVKASAEGSSKSLNAASRVENREDLIRQVDFVSSRYHQPVLIEEFIQGQEFTVAVLGNNPPQAAPVVQVSIGDGEDLGDRFFTYDMVVDEDILTYLCPARIPADLARTIQDLAIRAFQSVGCRDFGRVDFRVDRDGTPYALEVNPLPSLGMNDVFNVFPQAMGITYDAVIQRILRFALERYGMVSPVGNERIVTI